MAEKLREALLYEKTGDNTVQCKLCARYCKIPEGKRGFCLVRQNEGGKLYSLSYGKAAGLEIDPIEKKPFFHFHPGSSKVLSFGTPGCNFRCKGCFVPETRVFTDEGVLEISEIFEKGVNEIVEEDGGLRLVKKISALTHRGRFKKIVRASKHYFAGELVVVKPYCAPEFKCTPNHEVFALRDGVASKVRADQLKNEDLLLSPKAAASFFENAAEENSRETIVLAKIREMKQCLLLPIKKLSRQAYAGPVYNLEVEGDHSYLANFVSVGNCQNWMLSQAPRISADAFSLPSTLPADIAGAAVRENCEGIAYTYTEPTIFFEYARDTVLETRKIAPEKFHVFVSNGYFSRECFKQIEREKLLEAIRIDLKFIDDDKYVEYTSAHLEPVQESIIRVYNSKPKIHLEVINLVIPGWNDDEDTLRRTAKWVAGVGKDIPLHFIRFFPFYEAQDIPPTPDETLLKAKKIAEDEGIEYAYVGNTALANVEDTKCPRCGKVLIKRVGMSVLENVWQKAGEDEKKKPVCPNCGYKINIVL